MPISADVVSDDKATPLACTTAHCYQVCGHSQHLSNLHQDNKQYETSGKPTKMLFIAVIHDVNCSSISVQGVFVQHTCCFASTSTPAAAPLTIQASTGRSKSLRSTWVHKCRVWASSKNFKCITKSDGSEGAL